MSNVLERSHRQQLQGESGDGRGCHSMEGRKARPQHCVITLDGSFTAWGCLQTFRAFHGQGGTEGTNHGVRIPTAV